MKYIKKVFFFLLLFLFFAAIKTSAQSTFERKIVVFKPGVTNEERINIFRRHNITAGKELKIINAVSAQFPDSLTRKLADDPGILRIDPDVEVHALEYNQKPIFPSARASRIPKPTPTPAPQVAPWGILKIEANKAWEISSGSGVRVAVIDTGINNSHPDLKDNIAGCQNFIVSWKTCEDDNGHGTHVSGIIAAENNNIGVIGVAPNAKIYALKVLDRNGSGYLSDIIEALDWSIQNGIQVVNMSLGTTSNIQSFHDAVSRAYNNGIIQVAAAGNSGPKDNSVNYPAKYPEVIAVSATDQNNQVPSWSSRGPEVGLAAPGSSVYSTYLKGRYTTMSGTSMSSPHVAGTVALRLYLRPAENFSQISSVLKNNTTALLYDPLLVGAGLVNAFKVVSAP